MDQQNNEQQNQEQTHRCMDCGKLGPESNMLRVLDGFGGMIGWSHILCTTSKDSGYTR